MNDLHARVGRSVPSAAGLEVEEVEQIDAAPAPQDYPDPLRTGDDDDDDADPLNAARGICFAVAASAVLLSIALIVVALLWPLVGNAAGEIAGRL